MITEVRGDLLKAEVDALVNTVNMMGVMGKGLALQFKKAYPEMYDEYVWSLENGYLKMGRVTYWIECSDKLPNYILNFPTKIHWRDPSQLSYIEAGLDYLVDLIPDLGIKSIAIPPLGCGLGGLNWKDVEPLIREKLGELEDVDIRLYVP